MLPHQRRFLQTLATMESYREGKDSTFTSNGRTYQLDILFARATKLPIRQMSVQDLVWVFEWDKPRVDRVQKADLSHPVLVFWDGKEKLWVLVDGLHRLAKAVSLKHLQISVKELSQEDLNVAELK